LWQRETEKEKGADLKNLIFTGDRDVDQVMFENEGEGEEGGDNRPLKLDPLLIQVGSKGGDADNKEDGVREANQKRRKELLERMPKI